MAYKSFTNGFPLPASDLNNFLMDQSVITFASATERNSTLTAPKEGMLTYLEDTNTYTYYDGAAWQNLVSGGTPIEESLLTTTGDMIYASAAETAARLGIGSDGDVLSVSSGVPAWVTPSPAGAASWTEIASGSVTTGVSTFSLTGLGSWDKYFLFFDNVRVGTASSENTYDFYVNNSGFSSGYYQNISVWHRLIPSSEPQIFADDTSGNIAGGTTTTSNVFFNGSILINGSQSSGYKNYWANGGPAFGSMSGYPRNNISQGIIRDTDPITSIQLRVFPGTFSAGTYVLYGSN
jgi:hypothetical protein